MSLASDPEGRIGATHPSTHPKTLNPLACRILPMDSSPTFTSLLPKYVVAGADGRRRGSSSVMGGAAASQASGGGNSSSSSSHHVVGAGPPPVGQPPAASDRLYVSSSARRARSGGGEHVIHLDDISDMLNPSLDATRSRPPATLFRVADSTAARGRGAKVAGASPAAADEPSDCR